MNLIGLGLIVGAYIVKKDAMEALTPSVNYSWGWGHTAFACAIGQTGFWLPFNYKACNVTKKGRYNWSALNAFLSAAFSMTAVSVNAQEIGDLSEIYDQLQLAATVFAGVALLNALILGGYVLHHCQFAPAGCKSVAPNENASAM